MRPKPSRAVPESEKIRFKPSSRADAADIRREPIRQPQKPDLQHARENMPPSIRSPRIGSITADTAIANTNAIHASNVLLAARRSGTSPSWCRMSVSADIHRPRRPTSSAAVLPSISITAEPRSWLYTTCPFSRASWRRCGVASNDFSPEVSAIGEGRGVRGRESRARRVNSELSASKSLT